MSSTNGYPHGNEYQRMWAWVGRFFCILSATGTLLLLLYSLFGR